MEYIKRINKMWTSDTLFLRETLLVPSPLDPLRNGAENVDGLLSEDGMNGTGFPTLDVSCEAIRPVFPELSLRSTNFQKKLELIRTSSASSTSSTSIDCEKSLQDYLGSIDSQIKEAKSKAHKLQKTRYEYQQVPLFLSF